MVPEKLITHKGAVVIPYQLDLRNGYHVDFSHLILGSPEMQRLKEIRQLSPIHYVMSEANHTRHTHSVGTYYLAQEAILKDPLLWGIEPYEKVLLLLHAITHDIGHGPFSHIYEIVSKAYGGPDHKEMGRRLLSQMEDVFRLVVNGKFNYADLARDLVEAFPRKPLAKLVSKKAGGFDKLDYGFRDPRTCGLNFSPDTEELLNNLYYDGRNTGFHLEGIDAVRGFFTSYINNNKNIYLRKDVEAVEGFFIRALMYLIDNCEFDLVKGYSMTDNELETEMKKYSESARILSSIRNPSFGSDGRYVTIASIKPKGYGWAVGKTMRDSSKGVLIEEATDEYLGKFNGEKTLQSLAKIERAIATELNLESDEIVITYSPQIDRLNIDGANIAIEDGNGNVSLRDIFDLTPGLKQSMESELREHYAVSLVVSREKAQQVLDHVKEKGGFMKLLEAA